MVFRGNERGSVLANKVYGETIKIDCQFTANEGRGKGGRGVITEILHSLFVFFFDTTPFLSPPPGQNSEVNGFVLFIA